MSRSHKARHKERKKELEPREASDQARTSENKPLMRVGSIALIVTAVAVVGVLVAIGVSAVAGSPGWRSSSARVEKEVSALLSGIPQQGDTLGQASAPITLQIFGDLESEDVRTFVVWILPVIIHDWVRTNTVKVQYRSFMTESFKHPKVFVGQQVAALAAGVQDRLWNFIETFYQEQGTKGTPYVTEAYLNNIADQVPGLNISQWYNDRKYSQLTNQIIKEDNNARAVGFYETPSFMVGRTGGRLVPWQGYRLYEERGPKGTIRHRPFPLSFITSRILKTVIEHLP